MQPGDFVLKPQHRIEAVQRGTAFLKARLAGGEYCLSCRGSDATMRFSHDKGHVFLGFFLSEALAHELTEWERTILLVRILSEENEGRWGFSPPAPYVGPEHEPFIVDADDTAYVLRTCRRLGAYRPIQPLLNFYRESARGFVTFASDQPARMEIEPVFERNFGLHPEVNANVFKLLLGTHHERYINFDFVEQWQTPEGWWPAYFYPGKYFGTRAFLDFISDRPFLSAARDRALLFLTDSQSTDGSWGATTDPHETALALDGLGICGAFDGAFQRGAECLAAMQLADGSWRSSAVAWEYHDRGGDVWRAYDDRGVLTTSLAVAALKRGLYPDRLV